VSPEVRAASRPRAPREHRILVVTEDGMRVVAALDFASLLAPGDVVVVNDAATLPASLPALAGDEAVELRIVQVLGERRFRVAAFGRGDHRTRTEHRADAPAFTRVRIGRLDAHVVGPRRGKLVELEIAVGGAAMWAELYRVGRPVQYAHVPEPLALWDVQNVFASRPWAVEMPSASRFVRGETLAALAARGIEVVAVTHAAGISSIGDAEVDAALPFPERYEVRAATWEIIARARARGGRVVAMGTSTLRALEGGARAGRPSGITDVRIGPGFRCAVADAVLTGIHEPGTSHHELLKAFAPAPVLARALRVAAREGLYGHELGDAMLVFKTVNVPSG